MIDRARRFALGVWDFVVGDDWLTAIGVVAALGVTAIVGGAGWWVMPPAVAALLGQSLIRVTKSVHTPVADAVREPESSKSDEFGSRGRGPRGE